jgi:hypothetical protein
MEGTTAMTDPTPLHPGPWYLRKASEAAEQADTLINGYHDDPVRGQALATLALAHAAIAQTMAFGAMLADEMDDELAAPWLAALDPTGSVRAAQAARRAEHEQRREQDERERAERAAAVKNAPGAVDIPNIPYMPGGVPILGD